MQRRDGQKWDQDVINFVLQIQLVKWWIIIVDFVRCSPDENKELNKLHLYQSSLVFHRVNSTDQTLYEALANAHVLVHEAGRFEQGQYLSECDVASLASKVVEEFLNDGHVATEQVVHGKGVQIVLPESSGMASFKLNVIWLEVLLDNVFSGEYERLDLSIRDGHDSDHLLLYLLRILIFYLAKAND